MEPVNLAELAQASGGERNSHCARMSIMPTCDGVFKIDKGPSLSSLASAPANVLPSELADALQLRNKGQHRMVKDHVPLQFTLCSTRESRNWTYTYPVAVFIRSIDLAPDERQVHWALFEKAIPPHNSHLYFSPGGAFIRGWFRALSDSEEVHEHLRDECLRECLLYYDAYTQKGWLGEIRLPLELPTCGVVSNLDVFHQVLRKHFAGGFMESLGPDGFVRWGHILGGDGSHVSVDALARGGAEWRYYAANEPARISLVGTAYDEQRGSELIGDMFLCSDGTMIHSYHFSSDVWQAVWKQDGMPPPEWNSGYHSNRFYPPGSPLPPLYIRDSFNREMPAWFLEERSTEYLKN